MKEKNHHGAAYRREQIMQAATKLFARQGFEGTSTREIAELARVNEAIIFRHFPRKEDLYWAILEDKIHPKNESADLEDRLAEGEDDRQVFRAIAEDILRSNSQDPSLSRLLLFSALENHRLSHRFFRTYVADYYEVLAQHIRKRIRSGAFRPVDPLLAARGFLGMISYHFLIQELFGGKRYRKFAAQRVTETLTDIWLEGMRAHNHKLPSRHLYRGEHN
ncbi:MAG TPA: TetR/AcrR family transcriptional regulator [Terriglobia bacterium]|nr:TetR/AcrR family transcriptional regulator [Terriglobia bacterium]